MDKEVFDLVFDSVLYVMNTDNTASRVELHVERDEETGEYVLTQLGEKYEPDTKMGLGAFQITHSETSEQRFSSLVELFDALAKCEVLIG